jgi:K+-transporting ATPase ATPase C chain
VRSDVDESVAPEEPPPKKRRRKLNRVRLKLKPTLAMLFLLCFATGLLIPGVLAGIAQSFLSHFADGSLVAPKKDKPGTALIVQKFVQPSYFHPKAMPVPKPLTSVTTDTGPGFDPFITPASAHEQVGRVAIERDMSVQEVRALVIAYTEQRQYGFFGTPKVNVLLLNIALDSVSRLRPQTGAKASDAPPPPLQITTPSSPAQPPAASQPVMVPPGPPPGRATGNAPSSPSGSQQKKPPPGRSEAGRSGLPP